MGNRGIRYVINDSWEAGSQNWTDNMLAQFKKLRGYDATPWLPVLAGRIVESSESSDRFLWDFRKTIADLIANEHYGQLEETRSEEHTSELQSRLHLVCRLLLEKKKKKPTCYNKGVTTMQLMSRTA